MAKFRRVTWATSIIVAFLALLLLMLVVTLMQPDKRSGGMVPSATTAPASAPTDFAAKARLLAAGDGHTLWLVEPEMAGTKDKPVAAYLVLQRASNTGVWNAVRIDEEAEFSGFPRALAVSGSKSAGTALVVTDGEVETFTNDAMRPTEGFAQGHEFLAIVGSDDGAFALTRGVPPAVTTQPSTRATTQPAETQTAATATAPASQPAVSLVNSYWYRGGHWTVLPPLGEAAQSRWHLTPAPQAHVALVAQRNRLIALWVNPAEPRELIARSLEYNGEAAWSQPVVTELTEAVPAQTHLLPVILNQSVYVFWPMTTGAALHLHGGRLVTHVGDPADLTLPRENFLTPMKLTPSGDDVKPTADVAVAAAENSIAVVISGKDGELTCTIFNNQGQEISKATPVTLQPPKRRMQVVQNVTTLVFLIMLTLILWQWRHRPASVSLPADLGPAPLYLRAIAFTVDFGMPVVVTASIYGMWESSAWQGLITTWTNAFAQPEDLLNSTPLLTLMGIYVGHVTLCEMFFRRSVGKMVTGMQVLMTDGRSPTIAAVLVRNVLRVPEMIPGVLMLWVLISMYRQRIGDFFAGTIVVAAHRTVTPDDPDIEEKGKTRGKRDKEKVS